MENPLKTHWEKVYQTKRFEEVSWFQPMPETSIRFFEEMNLPKTARIIDIGAGESHFVDYLLDKGYTDITLVDISEEALKKTQVRLGAKGVTVQYIVADAGTFTPTQHYDFWHDRATFHFLTEPARIQHYSYHVSNALKPDAYFVVGTFAEDGPKKCSGLDTMQYSENSLSALFEQYFTKVKCVKTEHTTPFSTVQKFTFCQFRK